MADDLIADIRERYEYATRGWQDIRSEAAIDMRYVSGDPWNADDKDAREGRPTIAPDELGQYRNQVINAIRQNPRGMKFSPRGNGATDAGAKFYEDKARETEYRSKAQTHYFQAARNTIERGYGFIRVSTRYASHRSANQELWIEGFPDPDMVVPDPDALSPTSDDVRFLFVKQWSEVSEFKRARKSAKTPLDGDWGGSPKDWYQGNKILEAEYWTIETHPRRLMLVQPRIVQPGRRPMLGPPMEAFEDELDELYAKGQSFKVLRKKLRDVDYPSVKQYLTNGLEVYDETEWPGEYIPFASCYGPILYVPGGGEVKRVIQSMTRFGRDPWKAFCYASSQELEVLGSVPHAPVVAYEGQLSGHEQEWADSLKQPKSVLYAKATLAATGEQVLPLPVRLNYLQGEYLQGLQSVKEALRRSIQAAMGSNYLPTEAQRVNDKSGAALEAIDRAATQGTYHYIKSYEDLIDRVGVIWENLVDKIYDFTGDVMVHKADQTATTIRINDPREKDAVSTKGDYLCTVSTGPSSDSERTAADDFTQLLVTNIEMVAQVAGPPVAAAVLAIAIRMRNLGPRGDQLADLIEPAQFKAQQDGKPPDPQMVAAQGQIQQLQQKLQQAGQIIQTKQAEKQVEMQGKLQIATLQESADTQRAREANETKLAVAALSAKWEQMETALKLFMQERARLGSEAHDAALASADAAHELRLAKGGQAHQAAVGAADAAHAARLAVADHVHTLEQQQQQADLAPAPAPEGMTNE